MKNVILTDVDGVLLHWENAFVDWMHKHGFETKIRGEFDHAGIDVSKQFGIPVTDALRYIRIFNETVEIGHLPPLRDSIKYVRKLHEEHGYVFHAITSFSTDARSYDLRKKNLRDLFGKTAITKLVALGIGESKAASLKPYGGKGMVFIEDRIDNSDLAISLGIEAILMEHDYNLHYDGAALRVKNWREIYDYIVLNKEPSYYRKKEAAAKKAKADLVRDYGKDDQYAWEGRKL